MRGWRETAIGELVKEGCAELQTGPFGTMLNASEYVDKGVPVIAVQDIHDNRLNSEKLKYVGKDTEARLNRYKVKTDDIIFGRKGAVDRSALVTLREEGWIQGSDCIRLRFGEGVDARFISYQIRDARIKYWLFQYSHGATMPSLNQEILSLLPLALPPLPEQRVIAEALSSLDDKIDLFHRQNKTLEELAEALWRKMFVEEMDDRWREGKVKDLFILQRGFDLPTQNRSDGLYPIFAASGFSGRHAEYMVKGPGVTTGRSGLLGKVFFVMEDFWPLNTSLFIKEYKIGTPLFSYFLLRTIDLESFNAGSAVPTLNRNHVHEYSITLPPPALIKRFDDVMFPSYKKIHYNELQIRTLSRLRDTLLPKLMSGEVRVKI